MGRLEQGKPIGWPANGFIGPRSSWFSHEKENNIFFLTVRALVCGL